MARIRTIKPEFPQSESLGRVSRDARLLFAMLFTVADDAGRLRGSSRMLASLLFPYDDDAPRLIDGWLAELEMEGCIRRYEIDGNRYIDIPKWLEHQRIDHPSKSRIPEFREGSRSLANVPGRKGRERIGKEEEIATAISRPPSPENPDDVLHAFDAWNDLAKSLDLAQAQVLSPDRRKAIKARLRECGGMTGWHEALSRIRASPWMQGKSARGWKADLDFILSPKKFRRLMEGGYASSDPTTQRRTALGRAVAQVMEVCGTASGGPAGHGGGASGEFPDPGTGRAEGRDPARQALLRLAGSD